MNCKYCGALNEPGAKECELCGAILENEKDNSNSVSSAIGDPFKSEEKLNENPDFLNENTAEKNDFSQNKAGDASKNDDYIDFFDLPNIKTNDNFENEEVKINNEKEETKKSFSQNENSDLSSTEKFGNDLNGTKNFDAADPFAPVKSNTVSQPNILDNQKPNTAKSSNINQGANNYAGNKSGYDFKMSSSAKTSPTSDMTKLVVGILAALIVVMAAVIITVCASSIKNAKEESEYETQNNGYYSDSDDYTDCNYNDDDSDDSYDDISMYSDESEKAVISNERKNINFYVRKGDYTWLQAEEDALSFGGKLACITNEEEFKRVCSLAEESNIKVFWIGARRIDNQSWSEVYWQNGLKLSFTPWYPGEPSYETSKDDDGRFLMVFCVDGEWYFNDAGNDVSEYYSGRMGYIMEKDE